MTQLLTVDEAAGRLNVSSSLVRDLIARRQLGAVKVGSRLRVSTDQLEQYIAANERPVVVASAVLTPVRAARRGVRRYG